MKNHAQSGQTLIETIIAITVLVTALSASIGLTIFVLSSSYKSQNQIIATYLAREGVDVIRNMRDTNWLKADASGDASYMLGDCSIGPDHFDCFPKTWQGNQYGSYDLRGSGAAPGNYRLDFTFNAANPNANTWSLSAADPPSYALYLQADGSYTSVPAAGSSIYSRKIVIEHNTANPFSDDATSDLSELKVTSIVGWTGKNCPTDGTADPTNWTCKISIDERLSNWKNYY